MRSIISSRSSASPCAVLVLVAGDVVAEAERLEEVLVDDVGAGGDDGVDHVVADEVDEDLLAGRREMSEPARQRMTPQSVSRSIMS